MWWSDDDVGALQIEDAGSVGVYTCGPEAFMAAIAEAAKDLGVPPQQVFMESFNF